MADRVDSNPDATQMQQQTERWMAHKTVLVAVCPFFDNGFSVDGNECLNRLSHGRDHPNHFPALVNLPYDGIADTFVQ
jgi:hypothetical protein